jgi:hypothetical protein
VKVLCTFSGKELNLVLTILKSTSRRQGQGSDLLFERSPSANLRADGQKPYIRPNPWVSKHNFAKPVQRIWGLVNTAVVQRKIMFLPRESCLSKFSKGNGETDSARNRVKRAEVSRSREGFLIETERTEGSVTRRCL